MVPPAPEGFALVGLGFITSERHVDFGLSSHTFYAHDRMGGYYTRRFMGDDSTPADTSHGEIPVELSEDEAWHVAQNAPHFYDNHILLSRLLFACLENQENCAAVFGADLYEHVIAELKKMAEVLANPGHPHHPARAN